MVALRDYQLEAIDRLRDSRRNGNLSIILCLPTGAGKTVCIAEVIRSADAKGLKVLFLAHRQELVRQCSEKLRSFGVSHGILMAGEPQTYSRVQVGSKDTLHARAVRSKRMELPPADIVIADECHRSLGKSWMALLGHYKDSGSTVIGLTATPVRGDGRGLGQFYQDLVVGASYQTLTSQGFLVPTRVFAPYKPNLKGVSITNGDYNQTELGGRMDKAVLIGDIHENWERVASDRPTILFASTVAHSLHCCEVFRKNGIAALHVDAKSPDTYRKEVFQRFLSGDIQVITNVGLFIEGIDLPLASCCILARPTRSLIVYKQSCGRVMRPHPGKTDAIILDHAGAIYQHGFPDGEVEWDINPEMNIREALERQKKEGKVKEAIVCPKCKCAFSGTITCPSCGSELPERKGKKKKHEEGDLAEIGKDGVYVDPKAAQRRKDWDSCLGVAANRNGTFGMAKLLFNQKTGEWPPEALLPPREDWGKKVSDVLPGFVRKKKEVPA
jgi:DNA repair protein RadD